MAAVAAVDDDEKWESDEYYDSDEDEGSGEDEGDTEGGEEGEEDDRSAIGRCLSRYRGSLLPIYCFSAAYLRRLSLLIGFQRGRRRRRV